MSKDELFSSLEIDNFWELDEYWRKNLWKIQKPRSLKVSYQVYCIVIKEFGEYEWKTYDEVNQWVDALGKGIIDMQFYSTVTDDMR